MLFLIILGIYFFIGACFAQTNKNIKLIYAWPRFIYDKLWRMVMGSRL